MQPESMPEPLLLPETDESLRFVPRSPGFLRRTRLVNGFLGGWSIVIGTGSWLEGHLVARLGMATRQPNLRGCGINAKEVWDLVQQELRLEPNKAPLVVLTDSFEADQGRELMQRLRQRRQSLQILLLVQDDQWLTAEALADCQAQAIVHVQSFGTGTLIRALQALRRGQTFLDPRLQARLQEPGGIALNGRERQTLAGLARGLTNKQIAQEHEIAATTVRDYVSSLCRKLGVNNRTQVVSRAIALGLTRERR